MTATLIDLTQYIDAPVPYTDPLAILNARHKRMPGESYKLDDSGQYALDFVISDGFTFDESRMSMFIPFAAGQRRDGVGDLLEVSGIDTETRHRKNPIVLFDHGKQAVLPIAMALEWDEGLGKYDTSRYTVEIDHIAKVAKANAFFYQGKGMLSVDRKSEYDHALFCEQLYDMAVKGLLRGGSIGYQVKHAQELQPDYNTGTPAGLHLLQVLMLELSLVVLPANADTVVKVLSMPKRCGKPLSPYLIKSLAPYCLERKAQLGYERKAKKRDNLRPRPTGGNKLVRIKAGNADWNGGYVQSVNDPFGIVIPATSKETSLIRERNDAYEMIQSHKKKGDHHKLWLEEISDQEYKERGYKSLGYEGKAAKQFSIFSNGRNLTVSREELVRLLAQQIVTEDVLDTLDEMTEEMGARLRKKKATASSSEISQALKQAGAKSLGYKSLFTALKDASRQFFGGDLPRTNRYAHKITYHWNTSGLDENPSEGMIRDFFEDHGYTPTKVFANKLTVRVEFSPDTKMLHKATSVAQQSDERILTQEVMNVLRESGVRVLSVSPDKSKQALRVKVPDNQFETAFEVLDDRMDHVSSSMGDLMVYWGKAIPVPHGAAIQETNVPPAKWKPGAGATKSAQGDKQYEEGYRARLSSKSREENPYKYMPSNKQLQMNWDEGWQQADNDLKGIKSLRGRYGKAAPRFENVTDFASGDKVAARGYLSWVNPTSKKTEPFAKTGDRLTVIDVRGQGSILVMRKDGQVAAFSSAELRKTKGLPPSTPVTEQEGLFARKVKALPTLRKKYRPVKGLRRRVKSSRAGSSIIHISGKDLDEVRKHCSKRGLEYKWIGTKGAFEKLKLTGDDKAIDEVASNWGKTMRRK